jgi:uncharacterized protein YaiI (UPF0178 family)
MDHVLDQLREEGKPFDKSSMGDVMRLMGQDVKREGAKALEDANLEWKDVSQFVTKFTKEVFLRRVK